MLYFPMVFADSSIDGLIDKDALSSAISESDFEQIEQFAPKIILKEGPTSDF